MPRISESLAGRVHIAELWPFSAGEADLLGPQADSLLPALLGEASIVPSFQGRTMPTRREYLDPSATSPRSAASNTWPELPRILRLLAASTAQEVNDVEMASRSSIDRRTLRANYLPLLHTVYLAHEVPASSRNLVSRVAKRPKAYLTDTGIAAI